MNVEQQPLGTEQLQLIKARKNLYQLLHLLLSKPLTLDIYQQIQQEGSMDDLSHIGEGGVLLVEFFQSENVKEAIEVAREDYFRLFIGPDSLQAPPWESVYRGKEHSLFDFPTFEVRQLYSQYGLGIRNRENQHVEAEDHILFELEFIVLLIEKSLAETDKDRLIALLTGQKTMLDQHLAKWIPQFSKDIDRHAKSKLFTGVAFLLEEFISFDSDVVEELIREIN